MAQDGNSWSLKPLEVLSRSTIQLSGASRISSQRASRASLAVDAEVVWRLSSMSMRRDDDLHDENGDHRKQPRPGMSDIRFEHEMRHHLEAHALPNYINHLLSTTEESRDGEASRAARSRRPQV